MSVSIGLGMEREHEGGTETRRGLLQWCRWGGAVQMERRAGVRPYLEDRTTGVSVGVWGERELLGMIPSFLFVATGRVLVQFTVTENKWAGINLGGNYVSFWTSFILGLWGIPRDQKKRFIAWVFQAGLANGMYVLREDQAASYNLSILRKTSFAALILFEVWDFPDANHWFTM